MHTVDIIVLGAGIAGVSAAAELAAEAGVLLLEMEGQPGYHATGRSAAYFAAAYGNAVVRSVTACSESFLRDPPDDFGDACLFAPRDCMFFARPGQAGRLREMQQAIPRLQFVDAYGVRSRVPVFRPDYLYGALRDGKGGDLDVHSLLQGYLRRLRRRGGRLLCESRVVGLQRRGSVWSVRTDSECFETPLVVNAAGAWAGEIGGLAGLGDLGIRSFRRTALIVDAPVGVDVSSWPEMVDVDEAFYFKPEAGRIMISPADETPSDPCDAQPEDIDVATGVDRFEQATGLDIRYVRQRWAGLRTFAPDRMMVAGFDPRAEGFFWLAGQGGYGVQSAPSMAQLTRHLIAGTALSGEFAPLRDLAAALAPERLLPDRGLTRA